MIFVVVDYNTLNFVCLHKNLLLNVLIRLLHCVEKQYWPDRPLNISVSLNVWPCGCETDDFDSGRATIFILLLDGGDPRW